ncbi:ClC family H(+)/Cl(-) exchange transporter [Rudaeicoccus suwonensis]|uniref:CIC family chloride channel protein n=1 Tax=Rudaeicoccus suwonensis TaxID=657409 RepID=A0A561EB93_9MICO|nr:ClC family H(+)/Cl(-) exchange transporter [Rudaeicoccus suwonensis]TWE12857.1 CIC family chloride channel protein [Rudaeicoccus suwonensis]
MRTTSPQTHGLITLCLLAIGAGAGTGFVGGTFRWCLERAGDGSVDLVHWAHRFGVAGVLIPVVTTAVCAVLAGRIVRWVPLAAGSGIQHVEAVNDGDADAAPLILLPAKFLGGLLAIGSGLVLGREGPTVHMGAVIGAEAGRRARRSEQDVRLLQTSVGGAGLAVAFNAPIGGALFVLEEVTKSFTIRTVLPTALGVATAVGCSRLILGDQPDFAVPSMAAPSLALLPLFIVFGLLTGLLGAAYNRTVIGFLALIKIFEAIPMTVKTAGVGAAVGVALFVQPLTVGGGDRLTQEILGRASFAVPALVFYFVVRFLMGPLSYSAGTPGGLFAPLLALGALWGGLFASVSGWVLPIGHLAAPMAIVGMASFFAATVRAPLTGIVLVIEMTAITSVTVPMLAATGCAVLAAALVRSAPIYDTLRAQMLAGMAPSKEGPKD